MIVGFDGSSAVAGAAPPPKPPPPPPPRPDLRVIPPDTVAAGTPAPADVFRSLGAMSENHQVSAAPQSGNAAEHQPTQRSGLSANLREMLDAAPGWSTMASAAHAVYTSPDEIVNSLQEAATKNSRVAEAVGGLAAHWSSMSPAEHVAAANDLLALGEHSTGVAQAAKVIGDANALPQRIADGIAAFAKGNRAQQFVAHMANSRLGQAIFNRTVNVLPNDANDTLTQISASYANYAATEAGRAAKITAKIPFVQGLGTTVGDIANKLPNLPGASALAKAKVLSDVPIVGVAISTLSAGYDVGVDHENPVTAVTKEYTGTLAGQLAYNVTRDGLTNIPKAASAARDLLGSGDAATAGDAAGAAAAEGTADVVTLGAADAGAATATELVADGIVAGGPATWAIAGGVAAAVAVGYAATKFVEGGAHDFGAAVTKGGGEMVDGIAHGNLSEIGTGAQTAVTDVGKGFIDGGKSVADGFSSAGKAIGGVISSIF